MCVRECEADLLQDLVHLPCLHCIRFNHQYSELLPGGLCVCVCVCVCVWVWVGEHKTHVSSTASKHFITFKNYFCLSTHVQPVLNTIARNTRRELIYS